MTRASTLQASKDINGNHTDVLIQRYGDRIFVLVTQLGKVGNLASITTASKHQSFANLSSKDPSYDPLNRTIVRDTDANIAKPRGLATIITLARDRSDTYTGCMFNPRVSLRLSDCDIDMDETV